MVGAIEEVVDFGRDDVVLDAFEPSDPDEHPAATSASTAPATIQAGRRGTLDCLPGAAAGHAPRVVRCASATPRVCSASWKCALHDADLSVKQTLRTVTVPGLTPGSLGANTPRHQEEFRDAQSSGNA